MLRENLMGKSKFILAAICVAIISVVLFNSCNERIDAS